MTPSEYCLTRTGGPGTDLYYALWHLPGTQRDALTALHALAIEIDDTARECHEPQLAHTKLGWWREEIERAVRDRASHPATQALAPWLRQGLLPLPPLMQFIDATREDIGPVRVARFDELYAHRQRTAGVVAALAAGLLGARDRSALEHARTLGTLHAIARTLADAGADLRAGRIYLPADELAGFGLVERELPIADDAEAWRRFMSRQTERLSRLYDDALASVPTAHTETLLPDLVLAALQQALLEEIRAIDYRVLSQRVALTPLRRLWIAWRTRRRLRRSKPAPRLG